MDPHESSAVDWYVARGTDKEGPYSLPRLRGLLASGRLSVMDMVLKVGDAKWRRVDSVTELVPPPPPTTASTQIRAEITADSIRPESLPHRPMTPPPPEPDVRHVSSSPTSKAPWNPAVIAGFAILFTPMWAGVMAAVNGSRLRSPRPAWQPLAIGFGYLAVSIGLDAVVDSAILDWILYLGAAIVLWVAVLRDQCSLFEVWRHTAASTRPSWTWPVVAGVPLAILAILALVVGPLMPLEPCQVCERFLQASSEQGMKEHATKNLWPAIAALAKTPTKNELFDGELAEEGPAPRNMGGYVVGFLFLSTEFGQNHRSEGFFHLVERSGSWKIDDVVVTTIDHRPLENWSLLSRDYVFIAPAPADNRGGQQANAKPVVDKNGKPREKQWFEQPGVFAMIGRLLSSRVGKGIGLAVLAAVAVIAKFGKGLAKLASPSSAETK